jgi:hypothetical protein
MEGELLGACVTGMTRIERREEDISARRYQRSRDSVIACNSPVMVLRSGTV